MKALLRQWPAWVCGAAILACAQAWAAEETVPAICKHGDLHRMPLNEVEAGAPGAREAPTLEMGPASTAWVRLPQGASLAEAQIQPIPVPDLEAGEVEVLVRRSNGSQERVRVPVSAEEAAGLTQVELIRVRMDTYSYAMPEDCRRLSPPEQRDYARALLNNAGCLMPEDVHRRLRDIPGTPSLAENCGWERDTRLAVHLLKRAAGRGSIEAGWVLSQFYLGNVSDEFRDLEAAYDALSQVGGLGHASAQMMAGIMRWRGNGESSSANAAFPMLLPYARQGAREAQGIIGTMYLTGEGVPENPVQAYAWCSLAAADAPLMYSDPVACREAAGGGLSHEQMLEARDLAVEIHNGHY